MNPFQEDINPGDSSDSCSESDHDPQPIEKIEDMVLSFLTQLFRVDLEDEMSDNLKAPEQPPSRPCVELALADRTKRGGTKKIRFPRKSASGSARPLAQLLRVLDLSHAAVVDNVPLTKRDLFYKDVTLFKTQRVVDGLVDDLAATLEIERADLNVRASPKGMMTGAGLTIHLKSGDTIETSDSECTLVPAGEDIQAFALASGVSWILVVEKEAVFQTLMRSKLTNLQTVLGSGVLITGKGYPDLATRHLVKTFSDYLPLSIPILVLVDGDPYGIDILSVYRFGSRSLQHENEKLAASRVTWLGIWASELAQFGIEKDMLIPITKHDEKKAQSMLQRPKYIMPIKWRKELMYMLHSRRKAEIEVLSSISNASHPPQYSPNTCPTELSGTATEHLSPSSSRPLSGRCGTGDTIYPSSGMLCATPSQSQEAKLAHIDLAPPTRTTPIGNASVQDAPLLRYLATKITEAVLSARARAQTRVLSSQ